MLNYFLNKGVKNFSQIKRGFSMVEIILAVALISIFATPAILFSLQSLSAIQQANMHETAISYASGGLEAVRTIRDNSFDDLVETQGKGLFFEDEKWTLHDEQDQSGIYTRVIKIENAKRDNDGNVAENGNEDLETKHVTVTVSWISQRGENLSTQLETYLSNWK